jgi:hypothetical protein
MSEKRACFLGKSEIRRSSRDKSADTAGFSALVTAHVPAEQLSRNDRGAD